VPDVTKQRMTVEELRKARKASEEMGDNEFEIGLAPYTNYAGPIDASIARIQDSQELNLKGYYVPENLSRQQTMRNRIRLGSEWGLGSEEGTVNAVGVKNANGPIFSHEYRHKEYPEFSERDNRLADGGLATNKEDWDSAVNLWGDKNSRRTGRIYSSEESERSLVYALLVDAGIDPLDSKFSVMYPDANFVLRNLHFDELKKGATMPRSKKSGKKSWWELGEDEPDSWVENNRYDYADKRLRSAYWMKVAKERKRRK